MYESVIKKYIPQLGAKIRKVGQLRSQEKRKYHNYCPSNVHKVFFIKHNSLIFALFALLTKNHFLMHWKLWQSGYNTVSAP